MALLGQPSPVQQLEALTQLGDLSDDIHDFARQQGAGGEGEDRERAPLAVGQGAHAEPVERRGVGCRLPGQRRDGVRAILHQSRSLLQVQRLAAHRGHQVLCGREFLTGQGSAQASCEQRERSVDRQPGQIMRTAPTNRDPAGGADHQGASGKDIEQIASLRRIGGGVVDSDDEARLAQQLRALTGSELDRLVRAVQIGHQLL